MVKKKTTNYCFFLRLCLLRISCKKRRRWPFRGPKFKNFLGEHAPRLPPPPPQDWGAFVFLLPSFPPCTFKSSRCWLQVSYSLWNQCLGMEEAGGEVHFKNCYCQGGYNFHMKLFRWGRGMIHHTFLKTPFPLWDVISESETGEFFSRLTRPTGVWGSRASRA